jgi:hypothetical protein
MDTNRCTASARVSIYVLHAITARRRFRMHAQTSLTLFHIAASTLCSVLRSSPSLTCILCIDTRATRERRPTRQTFAQKEQSGRRNTKVA